MELISIVPREPEGGVGWQQPSLRQPLEKDAWRSLKHIPLLVTLQPPGQKRLKIVDTLLHPLPQPRSCAPQRALYGLTRSSLVLKCTLFIRERVR